MDSKKKLAFMSLVALLPLVGAGCAANTSFDADGDNDETASITPDTSTPTTPVTQNAGTQTGSGNMMNPPPSNMMTGYRDGTYSVVGAYVSPGGDQKITVALTVKDGVVTDSVVTDGSIDPASKQWQATFMSGYKAEVIGKKLDEISVTKVSGSSLTPKGFMDAVAKIKVQAKA